MERDIRVSGIGDATLTRDIRITGILVSEISIDIAVEGIEGTSIDRDIRITGEPRPQINYRRMIRSHNVKTAKGVGGISPYYTRRKVR